MCFLQDFIVWMRVAALPSFRKLYRKIPKVDFFFCRKSVQFLGPTAMQKTCLATCAAIELCSCFWGWQLNKWWGGVICLLISFAVQGTLQKGEKYDLLINDNFPVEVRNFENICFLKCICLPRFLQLLKFIIEGCLAPCFGSGLCWGWSAGALIGSLFWSIQTAGLWRVQVSSAVYNKLDWVCSCTIPWHALESVHNDVNRPLAQALHTQPVPLCDYAW